MPTLDDRLRAFRQAEKDLYDHLGVSRRLPNGKITDVAELQFEHGSGNVDIPTPYPQVLDYRRQPWSITQTGENYDDELHVLIDEAGAFVPDNVIRFNILTIWDSEEDNAVRIVGTHLPKPEELHYAHSDKVGEVEAGQNFYGETCVLLLTRSVGHTTMSDYKGYTG